jgi:hypothetical protein
LYLYIYIYIYIYVCIILTEPDEPHYITHHCTYTAVAVETLNRERTVNL